MGGEYTRILAARLRAPGVGIRRYWVLAGSFQRARANREERITSLAHHLTEAALLRGYRGLRANAAPGPDGETKASYGKGLKRRIKELRERLKTGTYQPTPAKRIYTGQARWKPTPDPSSEHRRQDRPVGDSRNPQQHLRKRLRRLQLRISARQESTPSPAIPANRPSIRTGEPGTGSRPQGVFRPNRAQRPNGGDPETNAPRQLAPGRSGLPAWKSRMREIRTSGSVRVKASNG